MNEYKVERQARKHHYEPTASTLLSTPTHRPALLSPNTEHLYRLLLSSLRSTTIWIIPSTRSLRVPLTNTHSVLLAFPTPNLTTHIILNGYPHHHRHQHHPHHPALSCTEADAETRRSRREIHFSVGRSGSEQKRAKPRTRTREHLDKPCDILRNPSFGHPPPPTSPPYLPTNQPIYLPNLPTYLLHLPTSTPLHKYDVQKTLLPYRWRGPASHLFRSIFFLSTQDHHHHLLLLLLLPPPPFPSSILNSPHRTAPQRILGPNEDYSGIPIPIPHSHSHPILISISTIVRLRLLPSPPITFTKSATQPLRNESAHYPHFASVGRRKETGCPHL